MGSSLMFKARKLDHEVKFIKPDWAYSYTEDDLKMREHKSIESGYWWIELGGDKEKIIDDAEDIHDELLRVIYGIWDHIKNTPGHNAENYDLEWVSPIAGKRESRRVIGDYILRQSDIDEARVFSDAVCYGGWPMDIHTAGGFVSSGDVPTVWNHVDDVYTIPYRSFYSVNIPNLFLAGRIISASHVAFSSSRVMATCAVGGEAVGNAAAIAIQKHLNEAREVGTYIHELQQKLLKDDAFIPGFRNEDEEDKARKAHITATEAIDNGKPENVVNGIARSWKDDINAWICDIEHQPEISLSFDKAEPIREIRLTFDSNLSREITPSIIREVLDRAEHQSPSTLVDRFTITLMKGGKKILEKECATEGQRHIIEQFDHEADTVKIKLLSSYGEKLVKLFEVRIY